MYRIFRSGVAIECDSPADVTSLLFAFAPPAIEVPVVTRSPRRLKVARVTRKPKRKLHLLSRAAQRHAVNSVAPVKAAPESEAALRRSRLRDAIHGAEIGLTGSQLRMRFPQMPAQARANALTELRVKGEIRRDGSTWVKA